jgi:choice-of-anchor C domain-containing protein
VVKIIDAKSGNHVTLNSGDYELALKGGPEGLKLSPGRMTLKRGETVLATITREGEPGAPPAGKPLAGLVAWWRADGNAKDSAGGNHGTLKGGVTFAPGVAGQAYRLDGATRYVEVPRSDLWGFGSRDFSIELWAQFRGMRPSHDIGQPSAVFIGCDEGPRNRNKWFFAYGGGVLNFLIGHANGKYGFYAKADFSPDLDQWYHLAVTRSRGTFTIYVDGVPVASEEVDIVIPYPVAPLTIGQAEGGFFFSGLIDEVAIYDRALSPAEVKARWSALAPATKRVAEKDGQVQARQETYTKAGELDEAVSSRNSIKQLADKERAQNLLLNGSFEEGPEIPNDGIHTFAPEKGSTDIRGWVVTEMFVSPIQPAYWRPAHGKRSFAMSWKPGAASGGGIRQDFKTRKGQKYRVSFWMAGDPLGHPPEKKLRVSAASKSAEFVFDNKGKNRTDMGWVSKNWEFTAEADQTTLEFSCLTESIFGVAIDDVIVVAVKE